MMKLTLLMTTFILVHGTLFAQNPAGMAVTLDGNGDYVRITDGFTNTIMGDDTYTVELWVCPRSVSNSPQILDAIHLNSSGTNRFYLELGPATSSFLYWATGSTFRTYSGTVLSTDIWHHIALVKTDTGNSGTLYINGAAQASFSGSLSNTLNPE